MALTRKFLTDVGLEADVITEIMREHGKSLTELNGKMEDLEDKLQKSNEQVKTLQKTPQEPHEDIQPLKDALAQAQGEIETLKATHEQQLKQIELNGAIDSVLTGQARDLQLVRSLLDYDAISIDESGNVQGLEEQVQKIKEQRGFLFEENAKQETQPAITGTKPVEGSPPSPQGFKEQYDQAMKDGNTLQAIAIKSRAFDAGQGFN